jgi:hypothetical protein
MLLVQYGVAYSVGYGLISSLPQESATTRSERNFKKYILRSCMQLHALASSREESGTCCCCIITRLVEE